MTSKRKDVPVFGQQYVNAMRRLNEGSVEKPPHPFETGGLGWYYLTKAKVTFEKRRDECLLAPEGTQLWYWRILSMRADELEAARKENRVRDMIEQAFNIGLLIRELHFQHKHGGKLDFHSEQSRRLGDANAAKSREAERNAKTWRAAAKDIWDRNPGLSRNSVAEQIAKKTGGNRDTIRKAISEVK